MLATRIGRFFNLNRSIGLLKIRGSPRLQHAVRQVKPWCGIGGRTPLKLQTQHLSCFVNTAVPFCELRCHNVNV